MKLYAQIAATISFLFLVAGNGHAQAQHQPASISEARVTVTHTPGPGTVHTYSAKLAFDPAFSGGIESVVVYAKMPQYDAAGNIVKDANGKVVYVQGGDKVKPYASSTNPPVSVVTNGGVVTLDEYFSGNNTTAPRRHIYVSVTFKNPTSTEDTEILVPSIGQ